MIIGIGTDIVEINRIKKAVHKWGKRFLHRIYTDNELSYCYLKKNPFPHLAGRFAAKEAAIKAFSGVRQQPTNKDNTILDIDSQIPNLRREKKLRVSDVEIMNNNHGMPCIMINNLAFSYEKINFSIHISISHERFYAIATVIIEVEKP